MDPIWLKLSVIPVLAFSVAACAFFIIRGNPALFHVSQNTRQSSPSVRRITEIIFVCALVIYIIVFTDLSLLRYESFHTTVDMAMYDNDVWHAISGHPFKNSIIDSSILWNNYFDPILFAFVPLYTLLGDSRIFFIVQTIAIAAAAFPIYWYARMQLGYWLALAVSLSFFLYPALLFVNLDAFHIVSLSIPILSFGLYFLLRHRYPPFLVCTLLAWMVKEEVSLILIGLGIYILLVQRKHWLGVCVAVFGLLSLFTLLNYVVPALTGKTYFVGRGQFGYYGASAYEIVQTMLTKPQMVWNVLSAPYKSEFVLDLLIPLAFLPLAGVDVMLTSFPLLAGLLLTNPNSAVIASHYPAALIPSLYFSSIVGLRRLLFRKNVKSVANVKRFGALQGAFGILVLVAALSSYKILGPGLWADNFDSSIYIADDQTAKARRLFNRVPRDAVVVAQEELVSHFSNRDEIYSFPAVPDYRRTDYLVSAKKLFFFNFHQSSWNDWMSTGYFEVVDQPDSFILAKRKEPKNKLNIGFGDSIILEAYAPFPDQGLKGGMVTSPIVEWRATKPIDVRYAITVEISDSKGHVWARNDQEPQGNSLRTDQWQIGKRIGDQYPLRLPPTMPTGEYFLTVSVHDLIGTDYLEAHDQQGVSLGTSAVISKMQIQKNNASFTANDLISNEPITELLADMQQLRLIGYYPIRESISAGEILPVGVYWRARSKPLVDYNVVIRLRDPDGAVVAEQVSPPSFGTYLTSQWQVGEVLLDWHDVPIPLQVSVGKYTIYVALRESTGGATFGDTPLASIQIKPQ